MPSIQVTEYRTNRDAFNNYDDSKVDFVVNTIVRTTDIRILIRKEMSKKQAIKLLDRVKRYILTNDAVQET